MANILIIGAGGVGSVVVHKCAQVAKEGGTFDKITLASRTVARCDAIAASVKRSASAPYLSIRCRGSMTLPFDFDIFAPLSSRTSA